MNNSDHPSEEAALEAQQELLESSLPLVFEAYDIATKDGNSSPVVILLDCEDEVGREIAESWLGVEAVQEAVEQRQLLETNHAVDADDSEDINGQTTVFAHAFPIEECRQEVPEVFPYLAPVFSADLPQDGFLVIAVTCGGASALTVPLSARDD